MGIFDKIRDKIFGNDNKAATAPRAPSGPPMPGTVTGGSTAPSAATPPAATMNTVDVEAMLEGLAAKQGGKSNWRHSIVDLMKLVGMESSLAERRELATELGYTGDQNDTAPMNIWLHKQVMRKLAENGGKVPKELMD